MIEEIGPDEFFVRTGNLEAPELVRPLTPRLHSTPRANSTRPLKSNFLADLEFGLDSDTEIPLLDFIIDHFKMRIDFIGPDGRVRFDIDHPSFIFRFKKEF